MDVRPQSGFLWCFPPWKANASYIDGTGLQGEFNQVMKAIEACHTAVHALGCRKMGTFAQTHSA